MTTHPLIVRSLGTSDYLTCWQSMQTFTEQRNAHTPDEIWFVQHPPVFTQGQNGKAEHIRNPGNIPVIQSDRGGQVTYHGPGQTVAYVLIDLNRLKMNVRELVSLLEQSVIQLLSSYEIKAEAHPKAPGVYVHHKKICSVGLRIRRGFSYHGLALNVDMDLEPFQRINPCGFEQLKMTQLAELRPHVQRDDVEQKLADILTVNLQGKRDKLEE